MKEKITQEQLKELLHYNPGTGIFTNTKTRGTRAICGDTCGNLSKSTGYIVMMINGIMYSAQRLSFLFMEGYFP